MSSSPRRRFGRLVPLATAGALLATGVSLTSPARAAIDYPTAITAVTHSPVGGKVRISWRSSGADTDYYLLETALTSFSSGQHGRGAATFRLPASARSVDLGDPELARAGAAIGSGRHLYFRLYAVNTEVNGSRTRAYPYLQALLPPGLPAKAKGTKIRAATFNVRTAKAVTDRRHWLVRKAAVAAEIKASAADVVAIQEMSPGRQDGKDGSTLKVGRQTTSLLDELDEIGLDHFELVRTTSYKKPNTKHGSQGARILYNSKRFELLSDCPEKTGKKYYNASCTISMPILAGDSESRRRKAAYAAFEDRETGQRFYVVSVHLDQRHSSKASTEAAYNRLRDNQVNAVLTRIGEINSKDRPVIFAGDLNSWQNNAVGHAPHDRLIANGFYDTAAATERINLDLPTINHFKPFLERAPLGIATRIDAVLVQGSVGSNLYWNKTQQTDTARPSDHNLVAADLVL